ncbi:hypothetical protein B296_00029954 [Ensete ventricosum]|uniref:Uncharacterized protein n=1 Tax=Ensete ventricosum TaxID=4639 RepID=A0A426XF18_ENSVE|nr:hypothetical protein B296_00029954 [Ensete ventricosum]
MPPIGPDGGTGPRGSMAKMSGVPYANSSFCFRLRPAAVAIVSLGPTRELSFRNPTLRPRRVAVDRGSERQKKRRRETNTVALKRPILATGTRKRSFQRVGRRETKASRRIHHRRPRRRAVTPPGSRRAYGGSGDGRRNEARAEATSLAGAELQ